MKYLHNGEDFLIYPESKFDILRVWLARLVLPRFRRTWKGNPYWYRPSVHTIECRPERSNYPNECCSD